MNNIETIIRIKLAESFNRVWENGKRRGSDIPTSIEESIEAVLPEVNMMITQMKELKVID